MCKSKRKRAKTIRCPYCGAVAMIRPASDIYHDSSRSDNLYVCANYPLCNSYVGMNTKTFEPFGPLANGDLRSLRIRAHRTFDQLWQSGLMNRNTAYRWMADFFCIPLNQAHIGQFSEYRCTELIEKCNQLLEG